MRKAAFAGALLFLIAPAACTSADPGFEAAAAALEARDFEDFEVLEILNQDGEVIRVNIRLEPPAEAAADARRRIVNALSAVRVFVPEDRRVAVWAYRGQPLTVEGMAFYSALTETVAYKTAAELQ